MKTFIILDLQNDFLPGGSLEVPNSGGIVNVINRLTKKFDLVIATQDWHPVDHVSFASQHPGKKAYDKIKISTLEQILWPDHCVQGSHGADFPDGFNTKKIETIFRKGTDRTIDSYSGFFDNLHHKSTGLSGYLKEKGVHELYFGGLAADICVYYSLLDALKEGFSCHLILDATWPLDADEFTAKKAELQSAGVQCVLSDELGF